LSQLDELIESDVLDALGVKSPNVEEDIGSTEVEDIIIEDFLETQEEPTETNTLDEKEELLEKEIELDINEPEETPSKIVNNIDMKSTDLASLLGELLNNKTIEITIKIKD